MESAVKPAPPREAGAGLGPAWMTAVHAPGTLDSAEAVLRHCTRPGLPASLLGLREGRGGGEESSDRSRREGDSRKEKFSLEGAVGTGAAGELLRERGCSIRAGKVLRKQKQCCRTAVTEEVPTTDVEQERRCRNNRGAAETCLRGQKVLQ
ncbi:hypothetical protein NDU88_008983 [Pleurodeles waltl]|uniref:Uncharacterized protein n=1 Tax=Pleurodeles waltl TaxID=8319 RepID=A0AAV7RYG5_PLEWA|nr:hypothetical protein NDU88_008983 [Pleurodeles waltl]